MKPTIELTSWSLILAMSACYANTPGTAVSGDTGPVVQDEDDGAADDGSPGQPPPHVFNPRPHPPRQHTQVPPPPDPSTLPRVVLGQDAADAAGRADHDDAAGACHAVLLL